MKNIFIQMYHRNPITNLFKDLSYPLKNNFSSNSFENTNPSSITKFFEIIAYHCDKVYKERALILSSSFPSNSIDIIDYMETLPPPKDSRFDADLTKFATERGLYKMKDESQEQFQSRIINAHRFLLASSTLIGLRNIIDNVINSDPTLLPKKFDIRELYTEDWVLGEEQLDENVILGNDVSSYYFVVDFGNDPIRLAEKIYLDNIIDLYKPAHIGYHINAFILDDWVLDDKDEICEINSFLDI